MEYYSKLNMEVEKSKLHTEWKIKRLQLDQSRIQLLSTEERNLKREKLELEHKRNGEIMEMSIESLDLKSDDTDKASNQLEFRTPDSIRSMEINDSENISNNDNQNADNAKRTETSSINETKFEDCDNNKALDSQGNVLNVDSQNNSDMRDFTTSSNIIGGKLNTEFDNQTFMNIREEALKNKHKVMCHEFCQTDDDNNEMIPIIQLTVDEENNMSTFSEAKRNKLKVLGTEFGIEKIKEPTEPRTDAQKEALINKRKVLGVEYNLPLENMHKKEPANIAQEEAVQNKNKILASEYNTRLKVSSQESGRKSRLTLNLKPFVDSSDNLPPNTGTITPGDFFPQVK